MPKPERKTEDRPDLCGRLLIFYLFLLFFRPFDLVPALKVLHTPMIFGGLCLIVYVMGRYSRGQSVFPLTPITKVLYALSVWVLITIPFSFWIHGSLTAFWNDWSKMVALFLLLANVPNSVKAVQKGIWTCMLGATGVSMVAIALKELLGESVSEGRLVSDASGLYSGPNLFSMTLVLLLPYALFFIFLHQKLLVRLFAVFVAAIFTVVNMMTESRSGTLIEAIVVIMAFWMMRKWRVSVFKTFGTVVLGGVMLLPLAPKGLWERFSAFIDSKAAAAADIDSEAHSALGSEKQRWDLFKRAVIMTSENPIFGVGMNNFPSASHARFNSGPEDWLGCHDTFLQVSSELGLPGLLLYILLFRAGWKTIQEARRRLANRKDETPDEKQTRLLADATFVSFCGFVLFSSVAHLGYQAYFFVVAGFGQSLEILSRRVLAPAAVPAVVRSAARLVAKPKPASA